jgi:prepilin-type N-terminal cleavage/methylation domain-containing protein
MRKDVKKSNIEPHRAPASCSAFTLLELVIVLAIMFVVSTIPISCYFESKTYNKLTGAETTWVDALFVELRVQSSPK